MKFSRRTFLALSGTAGGGTLALTGRRARGDSEKTPPSEGPSRITTTICPYCAVGCGVLVRSARRDGRQVVLGVEGDPDHPINEGRLCPKGAGLFELANNESRLRKVLYRAPGVRAFEEKDWAWAVREVARRIKTTRDASFAATDPGGRVVNRTTAIASIGSAALDNEECWLLQKFLRALGLVYIEHQARICHSSTVAALGASFGRGAMTNHWIDLRNADCILMMGANPAECHPIAMHWVLQARARGATLISVDPRYTRTAAVADIYTPLRAGTDIAFLGGMIHYLIGHNLIHREYVAEYTNAAFLVGEDFGFDAATGLFSGYRDPEREYDKGSWQYQLNGEGEPLRDPGLRDPRCVYQLLRQHYSRYDLDTVSAVTGTPVAELERIYAAFGQTGAPGKVGTILYAMGWTQHTVGTQIIRAMSIIQLLLGNVGRAGGGINALRGESNVQGSTDHALLFDLLPGYLAAPKASEANLADYQRAHTPQPLGRRSANWWGNYPKYSVSFLKSMFGTAANGGNDFAYAWLPKRDDEVDYSWLSLFDEMYSGRIAGFFIWGQNPACSGANAKKVRRALARLDWLVNVNLFPNESGWFWQDENLGRDPADIKTEVFVFPAAASLEKEGSITNSGRWMQWRYRAADPPGEARPDAEIMNLIYRELRSLYAREAGAFPDPILGLKWDYFENGTVDPHAVAKEINGYFVEDVAAGNGGGTHRAGEQVPGFAQLRDDGSTACGNWLYCGSYTEQGNLAGRRELEVGGIGLNPQWAWAWPANRRILYNRASVDPDGHPYDPRAPVIEWRNGGWTGDVPDGGWPPMTVAGENSAYPFIMNAEGCARLFAAQLRDGPFPEHYEPLESPLTANPLNGRMLNPAVRRWSGEADGHADPGSNVFPYVCTTFRLTEHWQSGVMTRHMSKLLELQPQMFVEISDELAAEKGIRRGDQVLVSSARGSVTAFALPTRRLAPLLVNGREVHQVAVPWCFGWLATQGLKRGDSANLLTPNIGDPNTMIPETKVFLVDIRKLDAAGHAA